MAGELALLIVGIVVLVCASAFAGWRLGRRARPATEVAPAVHAAPLPEPSRLERAVEGVRLASEVGARGLALAPQLAGSLRSLVAWAETERPDLRRLAAAPDGTVTLFFSDIEGSTALNESLGDNAWLELLRGHDGILRRAVRAQRGHVVKTQGDSVMAVFADPAAAVGCAISVQRTLLDWEPSAELPSIRVRVGLHTGEAIRRGRDFFGVNVAIAARVAGEARGGEILVSGAVRKRIREGEVHLGRGRRVELKGVTAAQTVYPVRWEEVAGAPV